MNVFVSIDGVLRNTLQKFDYHYKDYYLNSETDGSDNFEYGVTEPINNEKLLQSYRFQSEEELLNFTYIEFPVEIFGHAGLSYNRAMTEFNELIYNNSGHSFTLVGLSELGKAKPATLFFLSKNGCLSNNVKFSILDNIENLWDECDVWITDDRRIAEKCPKGKRVIKFNTFYNQHFTNELKIDKLSEIKVEWLNFSENIITSTLKVFQGFVRRVLK